MFINTDMCMCVVQALDQCKEVEADIEKRMSPLEKLRHEAQAEFDRVWLFFFFFLVCFVFCGIYSTVM